MVEHDFTPHSFSSSEPAIAPVMDRFLAFVFDVVLFSPVFAFILANLLRKLEMMYFVSPGSIEFLILCVVAIVFVTFLTILFQSLFLVLMSATPGKYFFKLQVISIANPQDKIRFSQALLRSVVWALEVMCLGLPFLEVASESQRRPLHDRASGLMVVTLKKQRDSGPHPLETHFVRQFLMFVSLCVFVWGIFFVGHFYKLAVRGEFKKDELQNDDYLCRSVSQNVEADELRIDKALAMYLADEISEECLAAEADFVLWTPNEESKAWAYLAKGMLKRFDLETFEAYLDKTCEMDEEGEACKIAQFEADPDKSPQPSNSRTAEILQVTHDFEKGFYAKAEKQFLKLSQFMGFEDFSQSGLVKAFWGQNKVERAKGAYQNVVHQMPKAQQMELAAWICHEELDRKCGSEAVEACEDLKENFKTKKNPVQESFIALALIREKECRKTSAVEYVQFQHIFNEKKDVLNYVMAISTDSHLNAEERAQSLRQLAFRKEPVRPLFLRRLALQAWVEHIRSPEELTQMVQFLKDKKVHDLSWIKIYERSMKTFVRLRAEKAIREIVQLPSEEQILAYGLKPLQVQAHYLARNYDKAWTDLQSLQQVQRAPASSDPLTLDFIRGALGKLKSQPAPPPGAAPSFPAPAPKHELRQAGP